MTQKIGITSDHGGVALKRQLKEFLTQLGYQVTDYGVPDDSASVDYPDYAAPLAKAISSGQLDRGVAVCGTGIGMCIAANKFAGVRAASVWNEETARLSREHNNSNVLCLGGRVFTPEEAQHLLKIWLETEFEGGRHSRRIEKIQNLEKPKP